MFKALSAVSERIVTVLASSNKLCLFLLTGRYDIITVLKSCCETMIQSNVLKHLLGHFFISWSYVLRAQFLKGTDIRLHSDG